MGQRQKESNSDERDKNGTPIGIITRNKKDNGHDRYPRKLLKVKPLVWLTDFLKSQTFSKIRT